MGPVLVLGRGQQQQEPGGWLHLVRAEDLSWTDLFGQQTPPPDAGGIAYHATVAWKSSKERTFLLALGLPRLGALGADLAASWEDLAVWQIHDDEDFGEVSDPR